MKFLLGEKLGMTQVWREERVIPITKIKVGPCVVTDIKDEKKDSYNAVQLGFGLKKEKRVNKPQKKQFKDLKFYPRYVKEFRVDKVEEGVAKGKIVDINSFKIGDKVDVIGWSKGRGFQGVVKRHGFAGMPKSHGTKDQLRMPGSAGAMGAGRIFKGKRSPGRMGNDRVTVKNLEIIEIDEENDILFLKGAVAGANSNLILIRGEGEIKVKAPSASSGQAPSAGSGQAGSTSEDGQVGQEKVDEEVKEESKDEVKDEESGEEESAQSASGAADESLTRDSKEAEEVKK